MKQTDRIRNNNCALLIAHFAIAALAAAGALALTGFGGCHSPTQSGSMEEIDTTSHNISWEVDTVGVFGATYFNDVAIVTDNDSALDIWTVGRFYTGDTTIGVSTYNIARYNGTNWSYMNATNEDLYAIYAFSPTDIWVGAHHHIIGMERIGNHLMSTDFSMVILKKFGG